MTRTQDQLPRWLKRKLDERGRGARMKLAQHLGVTPDAVTRMTNVSPNKEARQISGEELILMIQFFEEMPPPLQKTGLPSIERVLANAPDHVYRQFYELAKTFAEK